ncbi:DUF5696 domain-containing protein [Paenibacillus filicis]|uniref:DUF5696 domain-containing protein n=1 Tax=Paenibacillus gyeongsangnamensis TaxID=3388067 RepID=A0ABT4QFF9_9BACL|nr:DUF5696 domain-containing protein [Paenibacillus filicis]MCZ8515594.1 DUF5696 domain-containing protein [Paenibacillus filicis]
MSRISKKTKLTVITAASVLCASLLTFQAVPLLRAADNNAPAAGQAAPQPAAGQQQPAAGQTAQQPAAGQQPAAPADAQPAPQQAAAPPANARNELPDDGKFTLAAENASLRLLVDSTTAHFKLEDKRSGQVYRSFPDPDYWPKETITGTWRNNLRSPIMIEYIDMANFKSQPKIISWLEDKGTLEGFQKTQDGFKVTFSFGGTQFKIPVEVKLAAEYVETKIIDDGIKEGKFSLLNLKLYPMFGAEPSSGQDGYIVLPDGSGALIHFKVNRSNDKSVYRENLYGSDISYFNERTQRQKVTMPVFGMKSGSSAFVAVMTGGEEYSKLFASPSGAFGGSNWITSEWQYRIKFFQNTSQKGNAGFYTYSKEMFKVPQRAMRYYPLEQGKNDYVGMALKYRDYLMKEKGLKPVKADSPKVPFYLDIVGADRKQGLLWDAYLKGTTTSEAMEMVKRLYGLGIENMSIQYSGWQKDGYSSYGQVFPVDSRIGGGDGMKQFIQFAHSLKIPVFLTANYTLNNTQGNGFSPRYDGMRNLAGRLLTFENFNNRDTITLMSTKFAASVLSNDLKQYKGLGVDGIYFEDGVGRYLDTDFNDRYKASRTEEMKTQNAMLKETLDTLGGVSIERPNFYTLSNVTHLHRLPEDFSYDLFVDESIPFTQIALHGLITYTSNWANLRDQYQSEFLRAIEYGAYPSFVFTNAPSGAMKGAYGIWYYSMNYRDWEAKAVEEYQRFNQALGDVQNKAIVGHRTLAPNVKEVVYEGGKRIVINYNAETYTNGNLKVPGQDFIVVTGGKTP